MATTKTYIPPEILQLMELGRQKKLWALEILYNVHDISNNQETKIMWRRNLTAPELMDFREKMFSVGFTIPVGANHWRVICPMDIVQVDLYRQESYVAENYIMTGGDTQLTG